MWTGPEVLVQNYEQDHQAVAVQTLAVPASKWHANSLFLASSNHLRFPNSVDQISFSSLLHIRTFELPSPFVQSCYTLKKRAERHYPAKSEFACPFAAGGEVYAIFMIALQMILKRFHFDRSNCAILMRAAWSSSRSVYHGSISEPLSDIGR